MQFRNYVFVVSLLVGVNGHGRLLQPPSRSSMWRYETTDPLLIPYQNVIQPNYDDNGLNCGGRQNQIDNNGMCGVCGDPYDAQEKENEAGGKYAQGIITRFYDAGQVIDVTVEITAQHKGYFEFRLCPWNDVNSPITHECLNKRLLTYESGDTKWYLPENPSDAVGMHELRVRLPSNVTCEQCVLQWRYRTGNSWSSENGEQGLGLGQQEEFYGCSDVAIRSQGSSQTAEPPISPTISTTTRKVIVPSSSSASTIINTEEPSATPVSTASSSTVDNTAEGGNQVPIVDCSQEVIGQPIFRDCHSFYICAFPQYDPYIFACPPGTVCDPRNGRCDHPYNVPPPCNTANNS